MSDQPAKDISYLLGELNGKMDSILANLSNHNSRLDKVEQSVADTKTDIATLKGATGGVKQLITWALSVAAIGMSGLTFFKH